jgi:hypothetical protein
MLQGKIAGSIPDEVIGFLNGPNPSHVRKMNARNLPRGKGRPARKAYNLTAICETIV